MNCFYMVFLTGLKQNEKGIENTAEYETETII